MGLSARGRSVVVLLATVVGIAATVRLGLWQLDRAAAKNAIQARIDERRDLPPLAAADLARTGAAAPAQLQRRARLQGRWDAQHTVYLENRQMNGIPGFFVVTPLKLEGTGEAVVVERGWAPRDFNDRTRLPALHTPQDTVVVEGMIAPPPSRLYAFGADEQGAIRQNLDLAAFARETRLALLPLTLQQSASPSTAGDGLYRQWPQPAADVEKHYGYAFQWFALAATMAALYAWFQIIRPARRPA
jgi:surfeit locus 1 family protein